VKMDRVRATHRSIEHPAPYAPAHASAPEHAFARTCIRPPAYAPMRPPATHRSAPRTENLPYYTRMLACRHESKKVLDTPAHLCYHVPSSTQPPERKETHHATGIEGDTSAPCATGRGA